MEIVDNIKNIVAGKLTDSNQFLVDVIVKGHHKGPQKVLVVIDSDKGVTIDECADLSRELSKAFDETQLFTNSYMLEVSTPGLDQPLRLKRQYRKNIGRGIRVVKTGEQVLEAKLIDVTDDLIRVEQEIGSGKVKEKVVIEVPFSDIDKTFVLISFK
jgi:ribosome maturation factor RimP